MNTTTTPATSKSNDLVLLARRRAAHHAALEGLFGAPPGTGLALWRKLRRIERQLYAICEHYTNATNGIDLPAWELAKDAARIQLKAISASFGRPLPAGLYINGDPRGHMLKLDCGSASSPCVPIPLGMERDMGGDGILAADIS